MPCLAWSAPLLGALARVRFTGCVLVLVACALGAGATACARGSAELVEEGAPIGGEDAGMLRSDAGDAASGPKPTEEGGTVKPGDELDAGNPVNVPDAGGMNPGPDPRPVLNDIDPVSVAVSPASDVSLTVQGSAFVPRTLVQADGVALATTFVSSTELRAVLAKTALTALKTIKISVSTAAPGGGLSAATRDFRVVTSVPVLNTITPSWVNVGAASTELTASGSGFAAGAVLVFDNAELPASSVSASELKASLPAAQFAVGRSLLVRVKNPGTAAGASSARPFEVRNLKCSISAVSPPKALVNTQVVLDLTGTHLVAGSTVRVNGGAVRTPSATSGDHLTVSIPASDLASVGSVSITVTVPAPTAAGDAECAINLPVEYGAPAVTAIAPNPIAAGANDTVLTVTGTGFYPSSKIQLDGVDASGATTCPSATQCRTTLPAAYLASGKTVSVTVRNPVPGGGASNAIALTIVNPSPVLTTISPSFVARGSAAQTLTLSGSGFVAGSRVSLTPTAGGAATVLTPVTQSQTQLTVSVSASLLAAAAVYDVTVANPAPSAGPSASRPFTVWSGSCPTANVDVPIASTGVIVDFDLSWAAASTSTGIYGGSSSCGTALNPVIKRKFRPVVVQNNTPSAVVLSAWAKCVGSEAAWLAFYRGSTVPASDTELRMCSGKIGQGVGIYGAPAADSAGSVSCPGLMKADNAGIRLEACEAVVVYMQMQTSSGAVPTKLRVRADAP